MSNIIHPFPLPIYQDFINQESFNTIKEDTYNFISQNQDLFKAVFYCPTKNTITVPKPQNLNSIELENQIKSHIENYLSIWEFEPYPKLKISSLWVNIAQNKDYQETHNHYDSLFSGVIYISTNEHSGNFNFINPLSAENILMKDSNKFGFMYEIKPKDSMVLLFPGWLNHRALPNKSNKDRISISFNIHRI